MIVRQKPIIIQVIDVIITAFMMPVVYMGVTTLLHSYGYLSQSIDVAGTGSMYPSLYWDQKEGGPDNSSQEQIPEYRLAPRMYRYVGQKLMHGDFVAFQNKNTEKILTSEGKDPKSGFIKRVIGIPGDTIELRDGYVVRNGFILSEPYTTKPRSTYGGEFLSDCQVLQVPPGSYFVLGDNRKVSADSRSELGFVSQNDIQFYLPLSKQGIYQSLYRTEDETMEELTATLDTNEAIELLNDLRASENLPPLRINKSLTTSATKRGQLILRSNDFSVDATISGQTFDKVMREVGYNDTATGEIISRGYYTESEWLANAKYFTKTLKELTSPIYNEIGIAAVVAEVNSCPTQVVVTHLGGYIPPQYSQADQASWTKLRENLEEVIPSWEQAIGNEGVDQDKLQELLKLLRQRLTLAKTVEEAMIIKRWLTDDEQKQIMNDSVISDTINTLINEIYKK